MDIINSVDQIIIHRFLWLVNSALRHHEDIIKDIYDHVKTMYDQGSSPVRVSPFRIEQAIEKYNCLFGRRGNGFFLRGERNGYSTNGKGAVTACWYSDPDYYLQDVARMGNSSFEDAARYGNTGFEEVARQAESSRLVVQ